MKYPLFVVAFFAFLNAFSQDCSQAIRITEKEYKATAPQNGGEQELGKNKLKNLHYFEKEHHTTWYTFVCQTDCDLVFEIIPENKQDDYDFLLFSCKESDNYCEQIRKRQLMPIRSNISRNNKKIGSKTGVKIGENLPKLVHSGIGSAYSQSVKAKKGDFFVLVLDNVYTNGSGHTIRFENCLETQLVEKVQEKEEKTVEKMSDNQEAFTLLVNKADTLKTDTQLQKEEKIGKEEAQDLEILEDAYKKNETIVLDKLYFYGNSSFLKPESAPQVAALYEFLARHPETHIVLHAHTNGRSREVFSAPKNPKKSVFASNEIMAFSEENARIFKGSAEKLGEERGRSVRDFLIKKGIGEARIEIKSWGDKKMLYDQYSTEAHKNRRIEIEILK